MTQLIFGDEAKIEELKRVKFVKFVKFRRKGRPWAELRGAGPEDKNCKDCKFLERRRLARTYYKCGKAEITSGPGTDIRLKDPACALFEN